MPMGLKILVVGAGGLGCELLKLLAQDKTCHITIIDDDTIDPTNLNRQFLFTQADVGQSKAECAAKKLSHRSCGSKHTEAGNDPEIVALCARIQIYPKVGFYRKFDIVYNCLDNNETRSFVNQRCRLAGVLMIDGGSAGWLGQSFHSGGECFDCLPQKTETSIPLCTIRQNPSEFKHCLAWALTVVDNRDAGTIYEDLLTLPPQKIVMKAIDTEGRKILGQATNPIGAAAEPDSKISESVLDAMDDSVSLANISGQISGNENDSQEVDDFHMSQCKRQKISTAASELPSWPQGSSENEKFSGSPSSDPYFQSECESSSSTAIFPEPEYPILTSSVSKAGTEFAEASYPPPKYVIDKYFSELKGLDNRSRPILIYNLASLKARRHNIKRMPYMESQDIIEKIIPSICTTNSIVAALMVLSARNKRSYYLVQSDSKFVPMDLNRSSLNCLTCSVPVYLCEFSCNARMGDIITQFKAKSAVTETTLYDSSSDALIGNLDGHFAILYRNGLPFRFYFEMIEKDEEIREPVININRVR